MYIELTPEQRQLQAELRQYFSTLITPEEAAAMESDRHNEAYRTVIKRMGSDGKLGVGWPKEYGGLGFGPVEQQIFVNEANRADVPLPLVTLQTVGPTLQVYGTDEQKKKFLPGILSGDIHFAIGYSEPEAGTDLASLRTTAVRHGDEFIVNGQKMWTTGAHDADYIWLACRTDPDAPKHKGISILIVDTKDPGYSWTPIILSDGAHHTNASYYNDVRVPADMLVGEENGGWKLITTQLNHERVGLGPAGRVVAFVWTRAAGHSTARRRRPRYCRPVERVPRPVQAPRLSREKNAGQVFEDRRLGSGRESACPGTDRAVEAGRDEIPQVPGRRHVAQSVRGPRRERRLLRGRLGRRREPGPLRRRAVPPRQGVLRADAQVMSRMHKASDG